MTDMQDKMEQYFQACLTVWDRQWGRTASFANCIYYYIEAGTHSVRHAHTIYLRFSAEAVEVKADFNIKYGVESNPKWCLFEYKDPEELRQLKETFQEIARK
jgi:hypothetical protein